MPIKIKLRQKPLQDGRQSLYFDIYPPIFNPITGKEGRREFLKLYIYSNPETPEQKSHNKNTLQLANEVLKEKLELLEQGKYEFTTEQPVKVSFKQIEQKNTNKDFLIGLFNKCEILKNKYLNN